MPCRLEKMKMTMTAKKKTVKTIHAGNPHDANRGTRLSSSYAIGLRGLPCPPHSSEKTSAAYKAWLRGHKEFEARVVSGGAQRRGKASVKKTVKKSVKKSAKKTVKKLPVKRYPIDDDFLLAIITKVFGDILNQGVRPRNRLNGIALPKNSAW